MAELSGEFYREKRELAKENRRLKKELDAANDVINTLYESGHLKIDMERVVQRYLGVK